MPSDDPKPNARNSWLHAFVSFCFELLGHAFATIISVPLGFLVFMGLLWIGTTPWLAAGLALALTSVMIYAVYRYARGLRHGSRHKQ